jgi:hypothetical protein
VNYIGAIIFAPLSVIVTPKTGYTNMFKAIPVILTFIFFLLYSIISLPVDLLIRAFNALTGEED